MSDKILKSLVLLAGLVFGLFSSAWCQIRSIERVSVSSSGEVGDDDSSGAAVNSDGSVVAFVSRATNLVSSDTNNVQDVFARDRLAGTTTRVSVGPSGVQGNAASGVSVFASRPVCVSSDGTFIGFPSAATNLDSLDNNSNQDFFLFDRTPGVGESEIRSIQSSSLGGNGASDGCAISDDGSIVSFSSFASNFILDDFNSVSDVFRRRESEQNTTLLSLSAPDITGNSSSFDPSMSVDGAFTVFTSAATDLVSGDTNQARDIFLYTHSGTTLTRISKSELGVQGDGNSGEPFISEDGDYVVFSSSATNLVSGDDNLVSDVFLYTVATGEIERVSLGEGGVSPNGSSSLPSVSADGRYVAFMSSATNLIPSDTNNETDIFVYDRTSGVTTRVNLSSSGLESVGRVSDCMLSADGRFVVFTSTDAALVSGGSGSAKNVYIAEISPIVTPDTTLSPPQVAASGNKIKVVMDSFSGAVDFSASSRKGFQRMAATARAGRTNFRYQVTVKGTGNRRGDVLRKTSKKNQVTYRNVPSGSYNVSYRVVIRQGKRKVATTARSPKTRVTVQ